MRFELLSDTIISERHTTRGTHKIRRSKFRFALVMHRQGLTFVHLWGKSI